MKRKSYNIIEVKVVIVYIDILFLYNLVINSLLLYASGYALKMKINMLRIVGGGILGALYGIFSVICRVHPLLNGFLKLLCAFVMVYIGYSQSMRGYLRLLCTLFISSFCLCGIYMGFSSVFKVESTGNSLFLNLGFPYIFIVFLLFLFILNLFVEGIYIRMRNRDLYKNVEIINKGKKVKLAGFVDTGNSLTTPDGIPVAFVNEKHMRKIITKENTCNISFLTITGENEKTGFIPERFLIDGKDIKYAVVPVDEDFEKNFDILLGGFE